MNLFKEIEKSVGEGVGYPFAPVFTVIAGAGGYFQNVVRVVDVKEGKIVAELKKTSLTVCGEKLSVASFSCGDLAVKGKITKVEVGYEQR